MATKYAAMVPELTANLLRLYRTETNDADRALGGPWYPKAHAIMREWADSYGVSIATAAAVTAAISPQCEWTRNLIIADDVLADRAISVGGALHVNIAKARRIFADRGTDTTKYFKSGPKVASFSRNLAGDFSLVTVDTHATQAAMNDVTFTIGLTWAVYECFATAYIAAARKVGLEPAEFQAILWHTWKRMFPPELKRSHRRQWDSVGEF